MDLSDAKLLQRWTAQRNSDAFAELVARHAGMVYATALRILRNPADAEEVTQDCFLKLVQADRNYGSIVGWLHRVATNRSIDMLRKRSREVLGEPVPAEGAASVSDAAWAEIESLLDEAVAELPENLRVPVVLHYFEGRTHEAISESMGLSRSAVTRRLQRANDELRERLSKRGVAATAAAIAAGLGSLSAPAAPPSLILSLSKRALASDVGALAPASAAWGIGAGSVSAAIALAVILAAVIGIYAFPRTAAPPPYVTASPPPVTAAPSPSAGEPIALAQLDAPANPVEAAAVSKTAMLRCVDENGETLPGAEVYFLAIRMSAMPMSPRVDSDSYRIEKSGPHIANDGGEVPLPPAEVTDDEQVFISAFARIPGERSGCWNAPSGAAAPEPVITLSPSRTVSGTVSVPDGFAPRDVHVDLLTLRQPEPGGTFSFKLDLTMSDSDGVPLPWFSRLTPDADGEFTFTDIPRNAAIYLAATGLGLGEAQYFNFDLAGVDSVYMHMVPEGRIEGVIVHAATGRPAAAAGYAVYAEIQPALNTNFASKHRRYGEIRSDGSYVIAGLMEGTYSVALVPKAMPRTDTAAVLIQQNVIAGTALTGADIQLETGVLATGRVVASETGQGVEGVLIMVINPGTNDGMVVDSVRTDANGDYALRLPSGKSKLYFDAVKSRGYMSPKDQGSREFDLVGNERTVNVEPILLIPADPDDPMAPTDKTGIVKGRVLDAEGKPVADAVLSQDWAYKKGEAGQTRGLPNVGSTRADGSFEIRVNAGGRHVIGAGKAGYTRVKSMAFMLRPGEVKTLPDFVIESVHARISGVVVDTEGNPMAGVSVEAVSEHGYPPPRQVTGADGAFSFEGLPEEDIYIRLRHPLYQFSVEVAAPNEHHALTLQPIEEN